MRASLVRPVAVGVSITAIYLLTLVVGQVSLPVFALLAVGTVVLVAASPLGAIAAVTFTLPFFYNPLTVGGSELSISELILILILPGATLYLVLQFLSRPGQTFIWIKHSINHIGRSPLFLSLLVLAITGAVLLNFLFDPDAFGASLREWRWTLLEPLLYLTLLLVFARTLISRYVIAGFFLGGGLLLALLGIGDLVSGAGISGDSITRISGPYPHPNAFSLYLMRPLVLAIVLVAWSRNRAIWMITLVGIGLISIFAAFSRSAFAALAFVVGVLALDGSRRARLMLAGVVALASAILLALASDRMLSALSGGSLSLRLEIWQSSIAMIRDRPVAGYGPDQFIYAYTPKYVSPAGWAERFTAHGHNLVIDYWVRLGIIGAVFAASAIFVGFRAVADVAWGKSSNRNLLQSAAIVTLGAAILQGLVDNGYFIHDLAMSAWLLAFLAFDEPAGEPAEKDPEK